MQIKTSWPNGHHGTKDLVTNSKLACACWWSLGIELRVFLSLSGASNQHTFTPHADRAAEMSNIFCSPLCNSMDRKEFEFMWWIFLCIYGVFKSIIEGNKICIRIGLLLWWWFLFLYIWWWFLYLWFWWWWFCYCMVVVVLLFAFGSLVVVVVCAIPGGWVALYS